MKDKSGIVDGIHRVNVAADMAESHSFRAGRIVPAKSETHVVPHDDHYGKVISWQARTLIRQMIGTRVPAGGWLPRQIEYRMPST